MFSICFMRDADRRRRLLAYVSTLRGGRAALARAANISKGRVTQLLKDGQPFGERAGIALAQRLGLDDDYFEVDPIAPPPAPPRDFSGDHPTTDSEWQMVLDVRMLPEEDRKRHMRSLHDEAEKMRRYVSEKLASYNSKPVK